MASSPSGSSSSRSSSAPGSPQSAPVNTPPCQNAVRDDERDRLAESVKAYRETYRKQERERFKKYEADYTRYLMAEYYSDRDIYGDDIFQNSTVIDCETIKSSRAPTESYADPVQFLEKKGSSNLASAVEPPSTTNGN